MTLVDAILSLYPNARFGVDFVVSQAGDPFKGEVGADEITYWNADRLGARDDAKISAAQAQPKLAVPFSVSSAQAKIQLLRTPGSAKGKTLLDDVKAAVAAAGGEPAIWFAEARTWDRTNPYVAELGRGLSLTDEQIDDLFVAASQIAA